MAYLAGFFDGEGCIYLSRSGRYKYLRSQTVNTNLDVLEMMRETFGGHIYRHSIREARHTQTWVHHVTGAAARLMVETLRPHLVVKGERVDELLALVDSQGRAHTLQRAAA